MPTTYRQSDTALQKFHFPPRLDGVAVHSWSCTANYPQAVRRCMAAIALPVGPRK